MKNGLRFTILFLLLFSLSACGASQTETNPAAVIEAMEAKWNAKDVDGVIAMFAEDAIETNGRGLFYGREDLQDIFTGASNAFSLDCGNYSTFPHRFIPNTYEVSYECMEDFYDSDRLQVEQYQALVTNGLIKANILIAQIPLDQPREIDSSLP